MQRTLRLGVIASEFPPDRGGMQAHALGLVDSLAERHEVQVLIDAGSKVSELPRTKARLRPVMRWQPEHDLPLLRAQPVDAWITLNAGLATCALAVPKPVFAYVHGNDMTRPWHPHPPRSIRWARRMAGAGLEHAWRRRRVGAGLRAARWIFANSAFSRDLCARLHRLDGSRISVVPPGIRADYFGDLAHVAGSGLRLITVSRLSGNAARKNIDGVLAALARLGEKDISYTVIGDGDDLCRLQLLAAELGVADQVRFLGAVPTRRILEEFSRSDVFVMPVRPHPDDVEGFGMVYAEAAAAGLPSIGTRSGGIPEVIEEGTTGLLLDDVSPEAIARALRRVRTMAFDRERIRSRVTCFSAAACAHTLVSTIEALV